MPCAQWKETPTPLRYPKIIFVAELILIDGRAGAEIHYGHEEGTPGVISGAFRNITGSVNMNE